MCGIFGFFAETPVARDNHNNLAIDRFLRLARLSARRGSDASGLLLHSSAKRLLLHSASPITSIATKNTISSTDFAIGHSRLVTNGGSFHQPLALQDLFLAHNGIILNDCEIFQSLSVKPHFDLDSEVILQYFIHHSKDYNGYTSSNDLIEACNYLFSLLEGTANIALYSSTSNLLLLASNNGSLYLGQYHDYTFFASEHSFLECIGCTNISQVSEPIAFSVHSSCQGSDYTHNILGKSKISINQISSKASILSSSVNLYTYREHSLRRCSKCILPETMPFITFDTSGVCNYCTSYKRYNIKGNLQDLGNLISRYSTLRGINCIVPFSGGRDSTYSLHLIKKELGLNPITYTYDWGMLTDLGRRNISLICQKLGVENVLISANIRAKRLNVRKNLLAWLRRPNLGMLSVLTAGDKHFFKHIEAVKKETGVSLNLWGVNPLEVTHFKSGFLGIPPSFATNSAYSHSTTKQLHYQFKRLLQYSANPSYINTSLIDTFTGEYWRSFHRRKDCFHVFDFYEWNESSCEEILDLYSWERSSDTTSSWRIGDSTAAFYNYVYYTVAGFTEHDTFRSNQIRNGQLTRDSALKLVHLENQPRPDNIEWYLSTLGVDSQPVLSTINSIPSLY